MLQTLIAMSLITPFIVKVTALMTPFCHCKILLKIFSGFLIIKCKETLTDVIHFWQKKTDKTQLHLGDSLIKNSAFEKLLGVIDNKLCFDQHIKIETGLSDFLKWLLLLWKWNLRNWSHEQYTIGTIEIVPLQHLLFNLSMENISLSECDLEEFLEICFRALDRFAPCKKDFSEKNKLFMNRNLKKAQIHQNRSNTNNITYTKQWN